MFCHFDERTRLLLRRVPAAVLLCLLHNITQQHPSISALASEQANAVQCADDTKNRSLPQDPFAKVLCAKTGILADSTTDARVHAGTIKRTVLNMSLR
jgi:hypothetical protein